MRWIKASERLPQDAVTHSAKINYTTPEYTSITVENMDVFIGEETHYTLETFPAELLELIEWLDESIQDVPDTNVGEIPQKALCWMKKKLEKEISEALDIPDGPYDMRYKEGRKSGLEWALGTVEKTEHHSTKTPAPGEVPADIDAWIKEKYKTNGDFPTYRQGAEDLWLKVWPELSRLKNQLTEATNDRDVYKEWHAKSENTISTLTDKALEISIERDSFREALERISKPRQGFQRRIIAGEILNKYPKQ